MTNGGLDGHQPDENRSNSEPENGLKNEVAAGQITIQQLVDAVGNSLLAVDKFIFVFDRFCVGGKVGRWWVARALFCLVGISIPWAVYMVVLFSNDLSSFPTALEELRKEPIPFVIVVFLAVVIPSLVSMAFTHKDDLSYCSAMIGHGGRFGCYSFVLMLSVGYLIQ